MSISRSTGTLLSSGMGPNSLHSDQIRSEIQRFESVHPCIYQIYDLIDYIPDELLQSQIRDQVVAIEDSFVNSHEWTLSRSVSELRIGVLGGHQSGKTSLVHKYLTGTYTSEESPEGGRFKKEVVIDGQCHLLLIRDEGVSPPDAQFSLWADAVIFVFSVDNIESYEKVRHFCSQMSKYRSIHDMTVVLVGTKDSLSEKNPRVVSEEEGRQMAHMLSKRCHYYETCATYGLNVERVFKETASRVLPQARAKGLCSSVRTPTPTQSNKNYEDVRVMANTMYGSAKPTYHQSNYRSVSAMPLPEPVLPTRKSQPVYQRENSAMMSAARTADRSASAFAVPSVQMSDMGREYRGVSPSSSQRSTNSQMSMSNGIHSRSSAALLDALPSEMTSSHASGLGGSVDGHSASTSHLPTPGSTPTTQRKNRRISNIFQRKEHSEDKAAKATLDCQMGVGRAIPIKQGQLYKKSSKTTLNKEWKKKYVCLYPDGKLLYHHSLKEFMDNKSQGKEVYLGLAAVRVQGKQKVQNSHKSEEREVGSYEGARRSDFLNGSGEGTSGGGSDEGIVPMVHIPRTPQTNLTHKKKRSVHKRLGSGAKTHPEHDDADECFEIISHDQKRWEFAASCQEERDEWVIAIEQQIEKALQAQMSTPHQSQPHRQHAQKHEVQSLRSIPGNARCCDCNAPAPDWASLNLGILICIECSGIHRNLGSHISRVRSLELDDWPVEYLAVMQAIGNDAANALWEYNAQKDRKPEKDSSREAKEAWIRAKYETKRFLPNVRVDDTLGSQIVAAAISRDVAQLSLLLTRAQPNDVNCTVSSNDRRTPLHLACSIGSLEMLQLLLWNNADVRALDDQGRSGLWHAQNNGFRDCAAVLQTAGLASDYGMPTEGAILGSMSSREYSTVSNESSDTVHMRRPRGNFEIMGASDI